MYQFFFVLSGHLHCMTLISIHHIAMRDASEADSFRRETSSVIDNVDFLCSNSRKDPPDVLGGSVDV